MAIDRAVDSTKLNTELKSLADILREKSGTTEELDFYAGDFSRTANSIETRGSADGLDALVDRSITEYKSPSVTSIGVSAFERAEHLTTVEIPNVTMIKDSAFYRAYALTNFNLPEKLTYIGEGAFRQTSINISEIPAGVTYLGSNAFYNCENLESVTFRGTPKTIYNIFALCNNLETINVPWAEGEVSGAPWGATKATINYNYTEGAE